VVTQPVKHHVFVTKVHAQAGLHGQRVQEIAEPGLERVLLDLRVQLLKQSHAVHGIVQQALTLTALAVVKVFKVAT
jgi:hypothetical protein